MASNFERFGKYLLLEKLATGGMAEVFLSRQTGAEGIGKFCAIKRILPQFAESQDFIDMFREEAKIAINLNHSNVVSIHEFGVEKDQFFLVMDYVEGRNLRQILNKMKKSSAKFSVEQIVFIIKEVATGLEHAHRCIDGATGKPLNITHRDMSPQNIMISFEGEVKIVDFGIAKAETQNETTRAGTLKGKFGYMSPEQAEGLQVDLRTDVFSLGIVLWELLANDRLFIANNEINTLRKIRECQVPPLRKINPNIHPELERITKKVLTKDRNLRYQTAGALHRDLNRFLNRQYPDFSHQDFSVFIRTLFNEELLTTRKRLIEYARIPSPDQSKTPLAAENPQVPDLSFNKVKDQTLTSSFVSTSGVADNNKISSDNLTQKISTNSPAENSQKAVDDPTTVQSQVSFIIDETSDPSIHQGRDDQTKTLQAAHNPKEVPSQPSKANLDDDNTPSFLDLESINEQLARAKLEIKAKTKGASADPFGNPNDGIDRRYKYKRKENLRIQKNSSIPTFFLAILAIIFSYLLAAKYFPEEAAPIIQTFEPYLGPVHEFFDISGEVNLSSEEPNSTPNTSELNQDNDHLARPSTESSNTPVTGSNTSESGPSDHSGINPNEVGLIITSDPSGAEIFINGRNTKSVTPAMVEVPLNQPFRLDLRKSGYVDYYQEDVLTNRLGQRVVANLKKAELAQIDLDIRPTTNIRVFLNERPLNENQLPLIGYAIPANVPITIRAVLKSTGNEESMTFELPPNGRKAILLDLRKRQPSSKRK